MQNPTNPTQQMPSSSATGPSAVYHPGDFSAGEAAIEHFKQYARERPEVVTMWAFGLGFVLGWKLRIW